MKQIKYENKWYKVHDTKFSLGMNWYKIEDEPNHFDWISENSVLTIERNFYTRRCRRLEEKIQDYLNKD